MYAANALKLAWWQLVLQVMNDVIAGAICRFLRQAM